MTNQEKIEKLALALGWQNEPGYPGLWWSSDRDAYVVEHDELLVEGRMALQEWLLGRVGRLLLYADGRVGVPVGRLYRTCPSLISAVLWVLEQNKEVEE